jgi:DNA-binding transcriptional MocR family regulator
MIDLGPGYFRESDFPAELLCSLRLEPQPGLFQYGADQGESSFRAALAAFLTRERGEAAAAVSADDLLITNGNSHGLALCLDNLTSQGEVVLVESATYFLAKGIIAANGRCIEAAPLHGAEGPGLMDPGWLEERLNRGPRVGAVYIIPFHHNPTGRCYSDDDLDKIIGMIFILSFSFSFVIVFFFFFFFM